MRIRTRSLVILANRGFVQSSVLLLSVILVRIVTPEVLGSYRQVMLVLTVAGDDFAEIDKAHFPGAAQ